MHSLIAKSSVSPLNIFGLLMRLVRLGLVRLGLKRKDSILLKEKNLKKVWLGLVTLG